MLRSSSIWWLLIWRRHHLLGVDSDIKPLNVCIDDLFLVQISSKNRFVHIVPATYLEQNKKKLLKTTSTKKQLENH